MKVPQPLRMRNNQMSPDPENRQMVYFHVWNLLNAENLMKKIEDKEKLKN
jgi:hypothetical protein